MTYITFDISSVGDTVEDATLSIFGKVYGATNYGIDVYGVDGTSWDEDTITWNTKPTLDTTAITSFTVLDATYRWYTIDLTSYIQDAKDNDETYVTLCLSQATVGLATPTFASDESSSTYYERLVVTSA